MDTLRTLRIARLGVADRAALLALLRRLSVEDRHSRFSTSMTDAALAAYVDGIDLGTTLHVGAWSGAGTLVAVAEGFPFHDEAGGRRLEAAFATDAAWRRKGLARRLFASIARQAADLGFAGIVARCEARNAAMRSMLVATGALVESEPGELSAAWPLQSSPASRAAARAGRAVARANLSVVSRRGAGDAVVGDAARREDERLAFAHDVVIGEDQTARALFGRLPLGVAYAARLVPALATGLLVSILESACILQLQDGLADGETVVGCEVDVRHFAPAVPGRTLGISGNGRRDGRRVVFDVSASDATGPVATARIVLQIVSIARFADRLANKRIGGPGPRLLAA